MGNKARDFYNIDPNYFSLSRNPDYCSMCGNFKSKMKNHLVAHKLLVRDKFIEARNYY